MHNYDDSAARVVRRSNGTTVRVVPHRENQKSVVELALELIREAEAKSELRYALRSLEGRRGTALKKIG